MLTLYPSNRLERLAWRLADLLRETAGAPLQSEWVVVQHPGMARWLSLEIATRLGICANLQFPQPATFIWRIFHACLPELPELDRFQPARLSWRIHALLGEEEFKGSHREVDDYLRDGDELRRFQLAQQLATLFDRYLIYRPDWILAWEAGRSVHPDDHWQGALWRCLEQQEERHWVALQQRFFALASPPDPGLLPARVSIFGVPTLSPGYLEIIRRLAEWVDVNLFLLNPCETHWADIVSPKDQARLELRHPGEELYLEVGHPLLAGLGRQGRDFFAAVNEFDPGSEGDYEATAGNSLLQILQNQILRLESPSRVDSVDPSIAIHLCHSPLREVEVLYDQLLAMLEEIPSLAPSDILVMTPEIDRYAPFIEALFGEPGGRPRLPFRISDRSLQQTSPLARTLLEMLRLTESRHGVGELLSLLEIPAVRRRFGLDEEALETLTGWVAGAAIRWGRDGEEKRLLGLPGEERHTWRAGLQRLLLGYAMPESAASLWRGLYPLDAAEGSTAAWLGGLLGFCDLVFSLRERFAASRSPDEWERQLLDLTVELFQPEEAQMEELDELRRVIAALAQEARESEFTQEISLALLRHRLGELLAAPQGRGFLGGGISFCALAPMRSLPFRVICLLGMNDGAFPRHQPAYGFDLMAGEFRFGDRSRRADDRYLFLETLISARERLYLSYVGCSQRDNTPLPPAAVVDELCDTLRRMVGEEGLAGLIHRHPLQPFSPDYFQAAGGLFSYAPERREAARRVGRGREGLRPLVRKPLEEEAPAETVTLEELLRFYASPPRAFARDRLMLNLVSAAELPEEREPFTLEFFERLDLERSLVEGLLQGQSPEDLLEWLDAAGRLPQGRAGGIDFAAMTARAEPLAERLRSLEATERYSIDCDLVVGDQRLAGRLGALNASGLVAYTTWRFYPHEMVQQWLRHLFLNLAMPPGVELCTRLLEGERQGRYRPLEGPQRPFQVLLDGFREGRRRPLPFAAATSWVYVEGLAKGDRHQALEAARRRWFGHGRHEGEWDKPYHRLSWPQGEIFDDGFEDLAEALLQPLMDHLEWY